jgi:hypothetical protein
VTDWNLGALFAVDSDLGQRALASR